MTFDWTQKEHTKMGLQKQKQKQNKKLKDGSPSLLSLTIVVVNPSLLSLTIEFFIEDFAMVFSFLCHELCRLNLSCRISFLLIGEWSLHKNELLFLYLSQLFFHCEMFYHCGLQNSHPILLYQFTS
ncbi:hypothetical protein Scep_019216 [Stephania cephalantha]|uniref:Uncharacterized protein n=1 Tax=Stephania cephalantha TaxID=152367 RepID=A0AAP0NL41_9MAGN